MKIIAALTFLSFFLFSLFALSGCRESDPNVGSKFLEFSRIPDAHAIADGSGTIIAIADWQFDLKGRLGLQ